MAFIEYTFPQSMIYDHAMFSQHGCFEPGCVSCYAENAVGVPVGLFPMSAAHFDIMTGWFLKHFSFEGILGIIIQMIFIF